MSQVLAISQASDGFNISDLFACTYNENQAKPLPVVVNTPAASDKKVVTYGQSFELICQSIAKALGEVTITDYRDLSTTEPNISVDGCLRISNVAEVLHLEKVAAKILIIDNCAEVHISEVQCDHIAVHQSKKVAMANIDAENLLAYKCVDVTIAEFRLQYGMLQCHCIHLGDGSTKKTNVLSDVLFIEGALDRMSHWDLYSPIVHIGPMVPMMRATPRLRLYANADSPSKWEDSYGKCNLKKIMAAAAKVFGKFNGTLPTFTEKEKDLVNGVFTLNTIIKLLCGGDATFAPMDNLVTIAKTGMDLIEAEHSSILDAIQSEEDVSVFTMIGQINDRRIIVATQLSATVTAPGHVTLTPMQGAFLPDGGVPLEVVDPSLLMNAGMVQVNAPSAETTQTLPTQTTAQGNKTARAAAARAAQHQQGNTPPATSEQAAAAPHIEE